LRIAGRPQQSSIASTKSVSRTLSELPMFTTRQGATGDRLSPGTAGPCPGTASISSRMPRTRSST
jgi:hypothetical protein